VGPVVRAERVRNISDEKGWVTYASNIRPPTKKINTVTRCGSAGLSTHVSKT